MRESTPGMDWLGELDLLINEMLTWPTKENIIYQPPSLTVISIQLSQLVKKGLLTHFVPDLQGCNSNSAAD